LWVVRKKFTVYGLQLTVREEEFRRIATEGTEGTEEFNLKFIITMYNARFLPLPSQG